MEDKIRTCKTCGQQYTIKSGWKVLFRKPTVDDIITLFIVAMIIFSAYAYKADTAACRNVLSNLTVICTQYTSISYNNSAMKLDMNFSWLKVENGTIQQNGNSS